MNTREFVRALQRNDGLTTVGAYRYEVVKTAVHGSKSNPQVYYGVMMYRGNERVATGIGESKDRDALDREAREWAKRH